MENIKIQLKEQYNKSVDFYNKGDFEHYFFHVRKSIELIGKFLIHDTFRTKGEEDKAHKIISGESLFSLDLLFKSSAKGTRGIILYCSCKKHNVLCVPDIV